MGVRPSSSGSRRKGACSRHPADKVAAAACAARMRYLGLVTEIAMGKTTRKAPPPSQPATSIDDENPVWGDMLAGFFSMGRLAAPPASLPAHEEKPTTPVGRKAAAKRAKAG
jgi:hypothetical protein